MKFESEETEKNGGRGSVVNAAKLVTRTNRFKFDNKVSTDKKQDIDSERHPEEQNIDPKEYEQDDENDKK